MPLYRLKCKVCDNVFEEFAKVDDRNDIKCECGGETSIVIQPTTFHIFKPFYHPNLDKKPVWIKSKKHLKEESDKRNMTSYY